MTTTDTLPKADRTVRVSDLNGLLQRIAIVMIREQGFYTYIDGSGQKVLVVR